MSSKPSQHANSLFVLAAPSGAGKTTLVHALVKRNPDLKFSISYTTRKRRATEEHGRDYLFVTADEFRELQNNGELLESALVFDNHYGTSRLQVDEHLASGRSVVLEIDWQGAQQVHLATRDGYTDSVTRRIISLLNLRESRHQPEQHCHRSKEAYRNQQPVEYQS